MSKATQSKKTEPTIVMRKCSELIPAEYNPRSMNPEQYKRIKASLDRFDCVVPIVVNKHKDRMDIIVGGHQRVKIMEAEGIKEVPTVEVKLSLDLEKELNVRLNRNSAGWDMEALDKYFETTDLLDWGFEDFELDFGDPDGESQDSGHDDNEGSQEEKQFCHDCEIIIRRYCKDKKIKFQDFLKTGVSK